MFKAALLLDWNSAFCPHFCQFGWQSDFIQLSIFTCFYLSSKWSSSVKYQAHSGHAAMAVPCCVTWLCTRTVNIFLLVCVCVVKLLNEKAKHITGIQQWPYRAVSRALEVIPRTLIQNCGGQAIRTLTTLRVCALYSTHIHISAAGTALMPCGSAACLPTLGCYLPCKVQEKNTKNIICSYMKLYVLQISHTCFK